MEDVDLILTSYNMCFQVKPTNILDVGEKIFVPVFKENTLSNLCKFYMDHEKDTNCLIRINHPVVVVGDLHGSLHDLIRILLINGMPPYTSYLFLGDYVDRGSFSLEVITLLLALRLKYPNQVFLIRGNHEEKATNSLYGFRSNIDSVYGRDLLWQLFNSAFEYLPFMAIVMNQYFCVHGGISPLLGSIECFAKMRVPVHEITQVLKDLLWSDPTDSVKYFDSNQRGSGVAWGVCASLQFMKESGLKKIIRGHQCCEEGIKFSHNRNVITVFSASNYGASTNKCGFLILDEPMRFECIPALPLIKRESALFYNVCGQSTESIPIARNQTITLKSSGILAQSRPRINPIPHFRPGPGNFTSRAPVRIHSKTPVPIVKQKL